MLVSILSACVLCAVAEALMPNGPIRQVGKLVCGLVLLCAVLTPVVKLDWEGSARWLEEYCFDLEQTREGLENVVIQEWKTVIEAECATYIEDKARELGMDCTARVTCREAEGGTWLPSLAVIDGVTEESARTELTQILEQELKITVEYTREEPA